MSADDDFSLMIDDEPSPSKVKARPQSRNASRGRDTKKSPEAEKTREEVLRQELASVRKVNEAIEGILESLQKAKANMKTVNGSVGAASQLLNTWTKILSQTEHNQRLMLDPSWQGASQDIADIEEEEKNKQFESERREVEEQERKAVAAQRAEEDDRRRTEAAARASKSSRARGRGLTRGSSHASSGSVSTPSSGNTSILRAPSATRGRTTGIGRARGLRGK